MAIVTSGGGRGREAGLRPDGRGEIFPGLEAFIWVGILVGLLSSVVITGLQGPFDGRLLTRAGMGVGLGAIAGLFAGLGRGVWRPGQPVPVREPEPISPEPAPSPQLWDPWLDDGRDLGPAEPEVIVEVPACVEEPEAPIVARAAVRPRVISPETGEAIRLDDEIGPMIEDGRSGIIVIRGGPGSGKTTALRHLDAILPPWARERVRLLEALDASAIASAGADRLVILGSGRNDTQHEIDLLTSIYNLPRPMISSYRLAPWDQDDAIEYLLATDRDACASVMVRLGRAGDFDFLEGIPELCSVVLDRMAREETVGDVRTALRSELAPLLEDCPARRRRVEEFCLDVIHRDSRGAPAVLAHELPGSDAAAVRLARIVRHGPAALLVAADRLTALVERGQRSRAVACGLSRELVREVAHRIGGNAAALEHLATWVKRDLTDAHPLAASLLHAATPGWRPEPGCRPRLEGAFLDGVQWPGQNLAGVNLGQADLGGADLSRANLEKAIAKKACFHGANLRDAILRHWIATDADLGRANLSGIRAGHAQFRGADLSGAFLVGAKLWQADLTGARIEGADFTGATLDDACLKGLALRLARFPGARFGGADLSGCDMEDMKLNDADFHDANLRGAVLTGSRMPGANFLGADLRNARLAEIEWPGACLLDADLRGVNFHLGSTRSGMIDSPIPCEGSRTGFYTDDFLDRDVKPAEEIRKANLRGADLRKANIQNVDFYLVDLRGARYTADQATHLHRCRAILDERGA